jgi:hypothetical protein
MRFRLRATVVAGTVLAVVAMASQAYGAPGVFVGPLHTTTVLASTVPAGGDVNPYGVAVVPQNHGLLHQGDILVSNFNNAANLQGTGTTIVQITPSGTVRLFARLDAGHLPGACPGGVGLTTALVALRSGWVIVGSLPTQDGNAATAKAGCLIVLDSHGVPRETISGHGINGPWDMTARDRGDEAQLFVTNVLNGTVAAGGGVVNRGTVLRLDLRVEDYSAPRLRDVTRIGSGFGAKTDPAALVVGPTGVGLGRDDVLYVADSVGNRITAIPHASTRDGSAGTGRQVSAGGELNTPLGLTIAPNGDVLTVNAGDGLLVETTPGGRQVANRVLDSSGSPAGAGALFGLAVTPAGRGVYYVDDATNTLNLLH